MVRSLSLSHRAVNDRLCEHSPVIHHVATATLERNRGHSRARADTIAKFTVNVRGYTQDDDDMLCLNLFVDFVRTAYTHSPCV
jgi:hypothetical protein